MTKKSKLIETNVHDIRFCYDPSFDNYPILNAYEMFINKEDFLETETRVSWTYKFTESDYDWLLEKNIVERGQDFDEWFTSDYFVMSELPPKAIEFINSLPTYTQENLMEEN